MVTQLQRQSRLGRCTIDASDGTIDGPKGKHRVHPDAMGVLACLMGRPGVLVECDEILSKVWAGRDADVGVLHTRIGELRQALGDNEDAPEYIQSEPQRGYRLVAQVGVTADRTSGASPTLWSELKRRKVVRTALAYIAASWIVLQVVDTVTPPFPEQLRSVVLTIAIVGLPFALLLAWAYDITLVRDERSDILQKASEFVMANVNKLLLTGSMLAAVIAVAVVLQSRDALSFTPGGSVVLSFENNTDDNALGLALSQAFRIALEQSRHASVISRQRINEVMARMKLDSGKALDRDTAQEVAIREGAQVVVAGSISRIGNAYSILAEVIDPADSSVVYSTSGKAGDAGLLDVVEDIADDVRENLGESLTSIAETSQPLDRVATPNLAALRAFSLGREKKWRLEIQEAVDLLREAIELDPEFAFAHVELGALLFASSLDKGPAYQQWETALSFEDRLTQRDKLLIEALLAMRGSPEEVLRRLALLTNLYPNYATGHRMTGREHWRRQNDFVSAAENYARAAASDDIWLSYYQLGYCYLGLGRFDDAVSAFMNAHEQSGRYYNYGLADAYVAADRHARAAELLAPFVDAPVERHTEGAFVKLLSYHIDRGEFARAQSLLAELQQLPSRSDPVNRLHDDMTRLALLRYAANPSDYLQVLDSMPVRLQAAWDFAEQSGTAAPVSAAALLGKLAARAGRLELAQHAHDILAQRDDIQPFPIRRALFEMLEAELLIARGDPNTAIRQMSRVVAPTHLYQAHETLAYALEVSGETDWAVKKLQWLIQHRGQAFAEIGDALIGRHHSIVDSTVAHYRLGQALEQLGQSRAAGREYQLLMTRWQHADSGIEARALAQERLGAPGAR